MPVFHFDPMAPLPGPRFAGSAQYQFLDKGLVRVTTGARIHFGFLALPANKEMGWPSAEPHHFLPFRRYGGAGLMIPSPGISVLASPAMKWEFLGPARERQESYSQRLCKFLEGIGIALEPRKIAVEQEFPLHSGLGSGTQLALALGKAILLSNGWDMPTPALARVLERGKRSAIGIHGFDRGGLIVEGGKLDGEEISPLVAHMEWPKEWPVQIHLANESPGIHGARESEIFKHLLENSHGQEILEANARNVLMGILPAVASKNIDLTRLYVRDMNARTGKVFNPFNDGPLTTHSKKDGFSYCGQSSWGPACFFF